VPLFAVTVYVVPLPVTLVIEAPDGPVAESAKSVVSTPVTFSLKVTVHCTLPAFEGVAPTRLIEEAVGGTVS
jgi:hypothetical protein